MLPDFEKSKAEAQALIEKYDIRDPVVNVFDIVQKEGLKLQFVDMPETLSQVAGFFDPDSRTIVVNNADPVNRQVFTIAHELGHYLLKHTTETVLLRFPQPNKKNAPEEQEANCFAAHLLVPHSLLVKARSTYNLDATEPTVLAKLFGVSREMMINRLKDESYHGR